MVNNTVIIRTIIHLQRVNMQAYAQIVSDFVEEFNLISIFKYNFEQDMFSQNLSFMPCIISQNLLDQVSFSCDSDGGHVSDQVTHTVQFI